MALKKRKGYAIESKSLRCKLLREGIDLTETKTAFNEIVEFYYILVNSHPKGLDIPVTEDGGWRYYELLTIGDDPQYPLPFDAPAAFRRSAIRKAIGAYKSWHSNYLRWQKRSKRHKHHRPPIPPRKFNFSPSFDSGVCKDDTGETIMLKIRRDGEWVWVKFSYQSYRIDGEWGKGSPVVVLKGNRAYLTFSIEKYVPATGGMKNVMTQDSVRVLGIDMDLDKHSAICSVLETNARGETVEVARHFIKQPASVKCRKRNLGQIAIPMNQTGIIHKGFCKKWWERLHNREIKMGHAMKKSKVESRKSKVKKVLKFQVSTFIRGISLESNKMMVDNLAHLVLRLFTGKVKTFNKIFLNFRLSTFDFRLINDTSRLDPWGNQVWRGSKFPTSLLEYVDYQPGADWVATTSGYQAHSGLNAARNIGMKVRLVG